MNNFLAQKAKTPAINQAKLKQPNKELIAVSAFPKQERSSSSSAACFCLSFFMRSPIPTSSWNAPHAPAATSQIGIKCSTVQLVKFKTPVR